MSASSSRDWQVPAGLEALAPRFRHEMITDSGRLAALAGDAEGLAELAHIMRGKCAMFGDDATAGLLRQLEEAAVRHRSSEIAALIGKIVECVGRLGGGEGSSSAADAPA